MIRSNTLKNNLFDPTNTIIPVFSIFPKCVNRNGSLISLIRRINIYRSWNIVYEYPLLKELPKGVLMKYFKLIIYTTVMLLITLVWINMTNDPLFNFQLFESAFLNGQLNHQLSGLVMAAVSLIVLYLFADKIRLSYLNLDRSGVIETTPFLGIKEEGKWKEDGWSYAVIMIAIMGVTSFVSVLRIGFNFTLINSVMALVFALTNSFTEEIIFRLTYVTMGANETTSKNYGLVMGTVVFGVVHFWGVMPNGIFGVVISSLLGYFLTKSIQETKGFYWALMIHFLLDVVIMLLLFNTSR